MLKKLILTSAVAGFAFVAAPGFQPVPAEAGMMQKMKEKRAMKKEARMERKCSSQKSGLLGKMRAKSCAKYGFSGKQGRRYS